MSTRPSTRDRFVKAIVILAVAGGAFAAGLAYAAQPHMEAALNALLTAQTELKVAEHNKGGHRVKALDLVNSAIAPICDLKLTPPTWYAWINTQALAL